MSIVDELVSLLGLEIDPKAESTAAAFGKMLGDITGIAIGVGGALAGATAAIAAFAIEQTKAITSAGDFATATQLSVERVQELDYAAGQLGGDAGQLRTDLNSLNKSMSSDIPGEYNAALYRLGISARDASGHVKGVDEVLLEISDRLQGMSARRQMQFADQLGLSETSLKLIRAGREGVTKLIAEAKSFGVILDKEGVERTEKFNASMSKLRFISQGLAQVLAVGLIPLLIEGVEAMTQWVQANSDWLQLGITQVATGAARGFGMIGDVIKIVIDYLKNLTSGFINLNGPLDATGAIAIATAIGIGALAISLIAANLPLIAITAGVVALVLVLEDVYDALTGQPSLIGDWAKSFAAAYPAITAGLQTLYGWLKQIADFVGATIGEVFERWQKIAGATLDYVVDVVKDILNAIEAIAEGKNPFEVLIALAKKIFEDLSNYISSVVDILFAPISDALQAELQKGTDVALAIFDKFFAFINNLFLGLPGLVAGVIGDVVKAIGDGIAGKNPFDVLLDLLTSIKDRLIAEAKQLGEGLVSSIAGALNLFGMGGELPVGGAAIGGAGAAAPIGIGGAGAAPVPAPLLGAGDPNAVAQSVINKSGLGSAVQEQNPGARGPVIR